MAPTRRYRDLKVLYDLDFPGHKTILRQRVYKTSDGQIETPIVPAMVDRLIDQALPAPRVRRFTPRQGECCFENPGNVTGVSRLSVVLPYSPRDFALRVLVRQLLEAQNVASVRYFGETHDRSVEPYL